MSDKLYIYGRNSVTESINSGADIEKIYISFSAGGNVIDKIRILAKRERIVCVTMDKNKFSALEKEIGTNPNASQGIIALRKAYKSIEIYELIDNLSEKLNPVLVILDEISDPHNFGAIARTAECAGIDAIIRPERNSSPITPATIKVSEGALEYIPVVTVVNLNQALETLKKAGYWIIGTKMEASKKYYDTNIYNSPIAIVIGNEGTGIRQSVANHCDDFIKIPMLGKTESLNASVSAGIIFFEIMRQRKKI